MELNKQKVFSDIYSLLINIKKENGLENEHDALIFWYASWFLGIDTDEIKERIVKDTRGEGIDAILLDEINKTFYFVQAETVKDIKSTENEFSENKIKTTLTGLRLLITGDYRGKITKEIENFVDEFHDINKYNEYKTIMLFLTMKKTPTRDVFIHDFEKGFPNITIRFIYFDELISYYNDYLIKKAPAPNRISFEVVNESPSKILDKSYPIKARVFTVMAKDVANNYDSYKEALFQDNLRYNLETYGSNINEEIYKTSIDPNNSSKFWYFNNGITIVCKKIEESPNGRNIYLRKAQIINGAQTTYAIYKAFSEGNLKDDVCVLIKVIETDDKELKEQIAMYSNSQNAINLRDMTSNDSVQTKIQRELLNKGYFYERKRGEFDASYPTISAKRRFGNNYKDRLIENTNAAQAFLAYFLDKPSAAKEQKSNIFNKTESGFYNQIFDINDHYLSEKILRVWSLLKYIDRRKKEYKKQYNSLKNLQDETKKEQIYSLDFILHADYFILNIFKYYLDKNILKEPSITKLIENNDSSINKLYDKIIEDMAPLFTKLKKDPNYYPTKFFKAEVSIGVVLSYLKLTNY